MFIHILYKVEDTQGELSLSNLSLLYFIRFPTPFSSSKHPIWECHNDASSGHFRPLRGIYVKIY